MRTPDSAALRELYKKLEFNTWLRPDSMKQRLRRQQNRKSPPVVRPNRIMKRSFSQAQLDAWITRLEKAELFAFDTETTSLDYMQAEIVGVSFAVEPGEAAYVPLAHDYPGAPEQLDREEVLTQLKPLLEDAKQRQAWTASQIRYECARQSRHSSRWHCVRHHAGILRAGQHRQSSRHGFSGQKYLDHTTITFRCRRQRC